MTAGSADWTLSAVRARWTSDHVAGLWTSLADHLPAARHLRHEIHRDPCPSGEEGPTAQLVLDTLGLADVPDTFGGRIFRLGPADGPAIALRGELDALPIEESTGVPWASVNGAMHACGHDVHLAAFTAVMHALADAGEVLPVVGVLQPREETVPSGAADLLTVPALRDADIRGMFGVHVQPRIPDGTFSTVAGAVNASADDFDVEFSTRGGHAGYPHTTGDPIVAAAAFILAMQTIVARGVDPTHATVVTFGRIAAGTAPNVIPSTAMTQGTIRASDDTDRHLLHTRLEETARACADMHGCTASVALRLGEPILVNDPALSGVTAEWIETRAGLTASDPLRSCGADDFSYYGQVFPSVMTFVGVPDEGFGLHHRSFLPPDETVDKVARVFLASYLAGCEAVLGPLP